MKLILDTVVISERDTFLWDAKNNLTLLSLNENLPSSIQGER